MQVNGMCAFLPDCFLCSMGLKLEIIGTFLQLGQFKKRKNGEVKPIISEHR